ncbi:MAG TPA: DNA translocase FtsK [Bacteroidales bacterium]|nr:DNA translocase FtsK [Bacteroidales bacterium]
MEQKNEIKRPKNELRNEKKAGSAPEEAKGKTSRPASKKEKSSGGDNNSEKAKQIIGAFLLLFSVFLCISFASYLVNWFTSRTDDIFSGINFSRVLHDDSLTANNLGGRMGAALSVLLVKQGFGIGTFFLVAWIFFAGVRASLKHTIVPIWKSLGIFILAMVWLSVTIGFIFTHSKLSILGGISGYKTAQWLEGLLGEMGTAIALIFVFISVLALAYNFSLHQLRNRIREINPLSQYSGEEEEAMRKAADEKSDRFNTVEYAVKENETDILVSGTAPGNTIKNQDDKIDIPASGVLKETDSDGFEPVPMPAPRVSPRAEIEFMVETAAEPVKVPEPEQDREQDAQHFPIDSEYDPTLDLGSFIMPSPDLLDNHNDGGISVNKAELESNKNRIVETLGNYGIQIDKIKATIGPTVTLYEIIPAPGVRISKIKNLEDDIALSLSALGIRIIAPIPGKGTIGIEVPNQKPEIVGMKSILSSEKFTNSRYELPFGIGKTIQNEVFVADLTKMPHILMAGATGQGKSVGLNAIITSLLYKKHPSELKFVLVDPKKVELTLFSKIERHYLAKLPDSDEAIITDIRKVVRTLNSLIIEMESRYDLLKDAQVRNIKEYNAKFIARKLNPLQGHRFLPYIVLVIDEFADLIMTAGKEVEVPLTRLAQLARAIGIHLVIATQRPSVNIITGTIKANFPARIAFRVISKIDSRTILDTGGADQLIGRGDMLLSQGGEIIRLQCAFIDTPEVERITEFIGSQRGYPTAFSLPEYNEEEGGNNGDSELDPDERDELFEEAAYLIVAAQQGSTSLLQRKLKLGYNRAGRIIDQLEAAGIVGPFEGSKAREVKYATEFALEQYLKDLRNKESQNGF